MWDKELTAWQNVAVYILTFSAFAAIVVIGALLHALFYCVLLVAVIGLVNIILKLLDRRIHAPDVWKIPGFFMCVIISSFLMFSAIVAIKYANNQMPTWQAILLGSICVAFTSVSLGDIFYWSPRGRPQKHQRIIHFVRGNHAGSTISPKLQAFEDFLREHEDKRLWIVYNYIFIQGAPYDEVGVMLGLGEGNAARVSELCDRIVMAFAAECLTF